MKALDKLCNILDTICTVITVTLMIFITVMIVASVVTRFIGHPLSWSYEATLLCMSWTTFLGMAITFARDESLRLTFVSNKLADKNPQTGNIFIAVLDAIIVIFLLWSAFLSIGVVQNAVGQMYQTIPFDRALFYAAYPVGAVCSVFQIINVNVKRLLGGCAPEAMEGEAV